MKIETYQALGLDYENDPSQRDVEVNGRSNFEIMQALDIPGDHIYHPCAEAYPSSDVPAGKVTKYADWSASEVFPDTLRDVWLYTPADFDASAPSAVIVCNDGGGYLDPNGAVRAAAVFDSLRANKQMAQTVGVFVMPGRPVDFPEVPELGEPPNLHAMRQRSVEYDSVTDGYVRFLTEELLPFAAGELGCSFTSNPQRRTICGISSGGIAAFNAAWHAPDQFGCVLSHCGSFTRIRGGHQYPFLVRSNPRKAIRTFLTSGSGDADIILGNWPLANQTMAQSLQFAGYDYRFEFGQGGHNLRHGGAMFADSLRWLWR